MKRCSRTIGVQINLFSRKGNNTVSRYKFYARMNNALILFVRQPVSGKVKTRIAAAVGYEAALAIYKKLLQHTYAITQQLPYAKYVFYADSIGENDIWSGGKYYKRLQQNGDLGHRMHQAFANVFEERHSKVCIIGSDCFQLTATLIENAFHWLDDYDIVVGPATDGGYYLLAMKEAVKPVFEGIEWSTEKVLEQTLQLIRQYHFSYTLLPTLTDVDTIEDVPPEWKHIINTAP